MERTVAGAKNKGAGSDINDRGCKRDKGGFNITWVADKMNPNRSL